MKLPVTEKNLFTPYRVLAALFLVCATSLGFLKTGLCLSPSCHVNSVSQVTELVIRTPATVPPVSSEPVYHQAQSGTHPYFLSVGTLNTVWELYDGRVIYQPGITAPPRRYDSFFNFLLDRTISRSQSSSDDPPA